MEMHGFAHIFIYASPEHIEQWPKRTENEWNVVAAARMGVGDQVEKEMIYEFNEHDCKAGTLSSRHIATLWTTVRGSKMEHILK